MAGACDLAERLRKIRRLRVMESDRPIDFEDIGVEIAEKIEREKGAFSKGQVGRWFSGNNVPDLLTVEALAELFGADPGWLAFGELSTARAPGVTIESKAIEIVAAVQKAVRDEEATA